MESDRPRTNRGSPVRCGRAGPSCRGPRSCPGPARCHARGGAAASASRGASRSRAGALTRLLLFADMDEVSDAAEHSAQRRRVIVRHGVPGTPKAERRQRLLRALLLADGALVLPDQKTRHDAASTGLRASRGGRPRIWRTVSAERSWESALIVARTTFTGLVLPSDFERMSLIPADSTTARTEPPAMTPVPFDAGRRTTRAAPKSATT